MVRSISARCINSPTAPAAATPPPQPGAPPLVLRNRRITPPMDSTSAARYDNFSVDVVFQHYNQAISVLNPLLGPQSLTQPYQSTTNSINTNPITGANVIGTDNTEYGIVTDNTAVMLAAKYTWDPFKFYAGYEHIQQFNPTNPLGVGASAQGGYLLSGVEDNNLDSPKLVQIAWTGVKYALRHQNRHHSVRLSSVAGQLPCSVGLPAQQLPRFLLGLPQRGFALHRSSLHQAFRRFCRYCVFQRERRYGHRHSSRPRRPVLEQEQHCSDNWRAFHVLIAFRGVLNGEPARAGAEATRWVRRGAFGQSESRRVGKYRQCFAPDGYRLTGELG